MIDAALHGPPVLRVLAVQTIGRPAPARTSLAKSSGRPATVDPALRPQLLAALRDLLSAPATGMSSIVPWMAQQSLWDVAGHDLTIALPYADAVTPIAARYAVSRELARHDPDGYARARRPGQLRAILLVAAVALALTLIRATRVVFVCLALSAVAFAIWTALASGPRDLPPPPLTFLTVPALAFVAGGVVTGAAAWLVRRRRLGKPGLAGLAIGTVVIAAAAALLATAWTRSTGRFPIGGEGLELIFDPIAAGIIAGLWTSVLLAGFAVARRRLRLKGSGSGGQGSGKEIW